jgi:hypothetical protein
MGHPRCPGAPTTLHLQPRMVARPIRDCPYQALCIQKKKRKRTFVWINDGTNEQHAMSLIHLPCGETTWCGVG